MAETIIFWTSLTYLTAVFIILFAKLGKEDFGKYFTLVIVTTPLMIMSMQLNSSTTQFPIRNNLTIYNDHTQISTEWFEQNILTTIPPTLTEGVTRIIIVPHITNKHNELKKLETLADYNPTTNTIRIIPKSPEEMKYNLAHETGHHNYKKLTEQQKKEWAKLHNQTKNWVRWYAQVNEEEDYAEHYACTLASRACNTDEAKMQFINQTLLTRINWTYKKINNFYKTEVKK